MKRILQLLEHNNVGDWYLYEKCTELRIFGSNLLPYKFPKHVCMIIFSLEYLRQILNSDSINFMAAKKKTQFKLKNQVGPFIINHRDAEKEVTKKLSEFKFEESFPWNYDPQGILSKLRVKCKLTPFIHESKPEIEKISNQMEWIENTMREAASQKDTTQALEVSKKPETSTKRVREEGAYIAETTTKTKFKLIYNKRPKISPDEKEKVIEIEDTND